MSSVSLTNVTKTYAGGVTAVRDVSIDIASGEFVVLVGPSGCGKSTTLRMIAGLEEITAGEIHIGDRLVNNVPPGKRDIAMVFQNYALYPHMTARKNMEFGLRMRRTPKSEIADRVSTAATLLDIEELLDRKPGALSGGQRQRVALGRAIVRQPAAFLFDEPLSNLDAKLRGEMRSEIAQLHQRLNEGDNKSATMIYVTHDQVEAMTLGDRLVLMHNGAVQQQGTPLEVYNRPANCFVATFIGSPAMNLVKGEIRDGVFQLAGTKLLATNLPSGPALLGIRPEDLLPAAEGETSLVIGNVQTIEHLGYEALVHVTLADQPAIARLPAAQASQIAKTIPLTLRPEAVHYFAADDAGERLN